MAYHGIGFLTQSDGLHINKAVWRELNEEMKKRGYKGLLPFIACTLHIVHNAFHKGIASLDQEMEQLAFDPHCLVQAESTNLEDVSLFLWHVSTRWLTLSPALERIINRWDDAKKYFLDYLPRQQEYKRHLPKNKRYQRIVSSLKENEKETLIEIKFLVGVAPLFNKYLTVFQIDGPMDHCIFEQMKNLLLKVIKNSPKAKDLVAIDCSDASNQLPLNKIDFGPCVAGLAQKMKEDRRKKCLEVLCDSYVKMVRHLRTKLPLDSVYLHLKCLAPAHLTSDWTVNSIKRLCALMPQVVADKDIPLVLDQWRLLQMEDIPEVDKKTSGPIACENM